MNERSDEREREPSPEALDEMPRVLEPGVADFEPTPAGSWDYEPLHPAVLPSGNKVLLRRPQLLELVRQGDIPNPLVEVVGRLFAEEEMGELEAEAEERGITLEELLKERAEAEDADEDERKAQEKPEWIDFVHLMVWAAMAEPELSFEAPAEGARAPDGKLSIRALDDADKMFVFTWATGRVASFATFRPRGAGANGGGDGGDVRDEAERPPRAAA